MLAAAGAYTRAAAHSPSLVVSRRIAGQSKVKGPGVDEPSWEARLECGTAYVAAGAGTATRGPEEALALSGCVQGVAYGGVRHTAVAAVD